MEWVTDEDTGIRRFRFSDNTQWGRLERARLQQAPVGIQLGYISLRSDNYYIDRVYYLLDRLAGYEKRTEAWIKLVLLQDPMREDLLRFRRFYLEEAVCRDTGFSTGTKTNYTLSILFNEKGGFSLGLWNNRKR